MNIVFFGSSEFAVSSLKALAIAGHNILAVVTQPDRKMGRHLRLEATAVKKNALGLNLKILQPENTNLPETLNFLKELNADLFIVVSYGQILSKELLALPKIFAINAHASILPKYRGAAPINWAIIRGEKVTGVSIIKITEKIDAGPVILEREIGICNEDTSITLREKLSRLAADLFLEAARVIEKDDYKLILQNEQDVIFAPKLKKEDGLIDWKSSSADIYNLIRGSLAWPGAFTYYKGKMLKIHKAKVSSRVCKFASSNPGEIMEVSKEGIVVFTGKDNIIIEELQIEGKRKMNAEEFVAGHKISIGEMLGVKK